MTIEFLKSLLLIFGISTVVVFFLGKLKIPSVVGFLISGVILGPHGFQFINDVHEVEILAEIGVILLMFTIGLEFSLKSLINLRTQVLGGGFIQVSLTILAVALISVFLMNQSLNEAIFYGFLVSLSSTAIVIKLLMDRAEITSPAGKSSVGILIFQDLCVVPFMLLIPLLAGDTGGIATILFTMIKASLLVVIVLLASRWVVPPILHEIVKTRSRELFVITIILSCIGTAYFTSMLGVSLALGAFLAGVVISESDYASQAISDILPFKESFTALFFISVGMLMDINIFRENFATEMWFVLAIIIIKTAIATLSLLMIAELPRVAIQAGLYLSQIGEFSFVLALAGKSRGLLSEKAYQLFLSASVITMIFTPFMFVASGKITGFLLSVTPFGRFAKTKRHKDKDVYPEKKSGHVIIVGYGINGRNLSKVLRESSIPYVILEINANTVKKMKKAGEPIYYGDGTASEILHKMGIRRANTIVVAISDPAATRKIVQIARQENPSLHIIVRTRYVAEVDDLIRLGADEVIPEEFETSIEIFSRVLHHYHVPINLIREHIENIRKNSYLTLRTVELPAKQLAERIDFMREIETETYLIKNNPCISNRSIKDLQLRTKTGVTIIAVQRGSTVYQNPSPDFVLKEGDILLLMGKREDVLKALDCVLVTS